MSVNLEKYCIALYNIGTSSYNQEKVQSIQGVVQEKTERYKQRGGVEQPPVKYPGDWSLDVMRSKDVPSSSSPLIVIK